MNRRNYQRELEAVIKENESKSRVPRLLLHSCCAPCSSYVLEYLSDYFVHHLGSPTLPSPSNLASGLKWKLPFLGFSNNSSDEIFKI